MELPFSSIQPLSPGALTIIGWLRVKEFLPYGFKPCKIVLSIVTIGSTRYCGDAHKVFFDKKNFFDQRAPLEFDAVIKHNQQGWYMAHGRWWYPAREPYMIPPFIVFRSKNLLLAFEFRQKLSLSDLRKQYSVFGIPRVARFGYTRTSEKKNLLLLFIASRVVY